MKVSVIFSTYNNPSWLEKVLWGFECQTFKDFEIIIADDGSGASTRELIQRFQRESSMEIIHVWHPDEGFQKSAILNKAILASTTDYLIFTDGDCIPRKDFVQVHVQNLEKGRFLSGGYFMLPMETSLAITQTNIVNGEAFDTDWLHAHGLSRSYRWLKLISKGWIQNLLNAITPTNPTWNGHNSSGWKKDIVSVNGFNEAMQYGGQDRELGERLENKKIRGKQIRYSAVCVHLDHKRGYNTQESIKKNQAIRKETRDSGRAWTVSGIVKGDAPTAEL